jgi:hypothetical protein
VRAEIRLPPAIRHGTTSGWRAGCGCPACREAHNVDTRDLRRAWAAIAAPVWHSLLRAIRLGRPLEDAAARHGLTVQAVWGQSAIDPVRAAALEAALYAGRDPQVPHGTVTGYRRKCRCQECREAKAADR